MRRDIKTKLYAAEPLHDHSGTLTPAQASSARHAPLDGAAAELLQAVLAQHQNTPGALMPILHALQDSLGYVPPAALPPIAAALNLSRAEVHGVVSYYHHFRTEPTTAPVLQVCRAEACQAMGGEALWAHAQQLEGCQAESTYCLGLCASSPAVMWRDRLVARVTPERLAQLVSEA